MQSLKLTIKPASSFASPIMSDTLFGNFCWQFLEVCKEGEERLEDYLKSYSTNPFIVFSSGFPSSYLPRPFLKPEMYSPELDVKKYKKTLFVKEQVLLSLRGHLKESALIKEVSVDSPQEFKKRQRIFKNSINRCSNMVLNLYHTDEDFFYENVCFDIYIKYNSEIIKKEEILNVIEHMGRIGYGKDASTGKGKFEIEKWEEDPEILQPIDNANAFISLSHGLPDNTLSGGYFKTITKYPKHGGHLAITANPFKNPIMLILPGSVFFTKEIKPVYGRAINISPNYGNHLHSGFMLPFFVHIEGV